MSLTKIQRTYQMMFNIEPNTGNRIGGVASSPTMANFVRKCALKTSRLCITECCVTWYSVRRTIATERISWQPTIDELWPRITSSRNRCQANGSKRRKKCCFAGIDVCCPSQRAQRRAVIIQLRHRVDAAHKPIANAWLDGRCNRLSATWGVVHRNISDIERLTTREHFVAQEKEIVCFIGFRNLIQRIKHDLKINIGADWCNDREIDRVIDIENIRCDRRCDRAVP